MTETPVVSEILQAGLIVHVRIAAEDLSSWEAEDVGYQRRGGTLTVQVVDVLKGRLDVASGATVDLEINERGSASGLVFDFYGIWAHVPTVPGTELVAFCDGTGTDLAEQLTDEHCEQLVEAATVLEDLHLALGLDTQRLTADQLIEESCSNQRRRPPAISPPLLDSRQPSNRGVHAGYLVVIYRTGRAASLGSSSLVYF